MSYLLAPSKSHRNLYHAGGGNYLQKDVSVEPDLFTAMPGNGNYRGGYIATFDQMKMLRDKYGVTTIINVGKDSMTKDPKHQQDESLGCGSRENPCEPLWADKLGLRYVYVPMTSSRPPNREAWHEIREALLDGHAYLHCTAGVDRTGAITGRWRKELEGIDNEEALAYTYDFGGAWKKGGDPNSVLREWLIRGEYDPNLLKELERRAAGKGRIRKNGESSLF